MDTNLKKIVISFLILFVLSNFVSAAPKKITAAICTVFGQVITLAIPLASAYFVYGGAKYVYSADDPGGRKEGKKICVNALVGLVICALACNLVQAISGAGSPCPGVC